MRRLTNYLLFLFIFFFMIILSVNAECSYQERKDLLNEAKSVEASFSIESKMVKEEIINPNTEEKETVDKKQYYFNLNITNLSDNLFIKLTNDNNSDEVVINSGNFVNGVYSYEVINLMDIIKYNLSFYSTNENCYAEKVFSKEIKKPKENPVYYFSVCSNEKLENNKYCQHFIDKDFNMNPYDIVSKLNKMLDEEEKVSEEKTLIKSLKDIFSDYWYLFVILVMVIVAIIVLLIFRKKRSEL